MQERADVQALLEAQGLYVADDVGQPVIPPVVFIDRDNPYVVPTAEEATFDEQYSVRFRVLGVLDVATNDAASDAFDEMIMTIGAAFYGYSIDITQVSSPLEVELSQTTYVGVEILIDVGTNLKE